MTAAKNKIYLPDVVGKHYKDFWHFKGRYRVCKGSRASKKSKTTALWFIYNLMKNPDANLLVIRKIFRTMKDSCFKELKWAINRLGVAQYWNVKESPLEMTCIPTGQTIYFRGLDDPLKITSITVETGYLCWGWIEEAYEIMNEADFDILDESLRGNLPEGLFYQWTLTFNPWNQYHWIKKRFFDVNEKDGEEIVETLSSGTVKRFYDEEIDESVDTLAITTTYLMNEFIDKQTLAMFKRMKRLNPRRYNVAGMGNWGIVDGVIFEKWIEILFDIDEVRSRAGVKSCFGLDFGYTNDPTALFCGLIDPKAKQLWVFDEMYEYGMSNEAIFKEVSRMGYVKERIIADNEPKSIDRLELLGMFNIRKARKGKDSINAGIDFLQDFEIIVHPRCVNFLTEISNYTWGEDKSGRKINKPIDGFNHLMDAMRYAVESFSKPSSFSFD
ncbi:MAG: PBSX family phage terminase large subunit [Defluviitaleaceae bacterium]|nr:PBSX family phage terminase large subunit [Defluviitaleaceae bacterium]